MATESAMHTLKNAIKAVIESGFTTIPDQGRLKAVVAAVEGLASSCAGAGAADDGGGALTQRGAEALWEAACELWNYCVECANSSAAEQKPDGDAACEDAAAAAPAPASADALRATLAALRHAACDAVALIGGGQLAEEEHVTRLGFALKTAQEWAALGDAARSAVALARAAPWAAVFEEVAAEADGDAGGGPARPKEQRAGYAGLAFDAALARACAAWQLGDEVLAMRCIERCRTVIIDGAADAIDANLARRLRLRLVAQLQKQAATVLVPPSLEDDCKQLLPNSGKEAGGGHANSSSGSAADASPVQLQAALCQLKAAYELLQRVRATAPLPAEAAAADGNTNTAKPAAADVDATELALLEGRVLASLALAHQLAGDAPATLACVRALRSLASPKTAAGGSSGASAAAAAAASATEHPAIALLAFAAHARAGSVAAAAGEALGVVAAEGASREACLGVALELLQMSGGGDSGSGEAGDNGDALRPVLDLVLGRFPGDAGVLARIVAAALEGGGVGAATAAPGGDVLCPHEALALDLLEQHSGGLVCEGGGGNGDTSDAAQQGGSGNVGGAICAPLAAHAARLFNARRFAAAARFYSAAARFAAAAPAKGGLCRCLALCHMALGARGRAAEAAALSEQYAPRQVATAFVRFKLALDGGDAGAAAREVGLLVQADGFEPAVLQMACQEALHVGAAAVAREALTRLHTLLAARADARMAQQKKQQKQQQQNLEVTDSAGNHAKRQRVGDDCGCDGSDAAAAAAAADHGPPRSSGAGDGDGGSDSTDEPLLPEGTVLRCLVKLCLDEVAAAVASGGSGGCSAGSKGAVGGPSDAKGAAVGGSDARQAADQQQPQQKEQRRVQSSPPSLPEALGRLGAALRLAAARIAALGGAAAFVGPRDAAAAGEHVAWLAGAAWNAGLDAADAHCLQEAAVLMDACAELLARVPSPAPRHLAQQRMAYLVAASAALEVMKGRPAGGAGAGGGGGGGGGSLELADRMLAASRAAAARLAEMEAAAAAAAAAAAGAGNRGEGGQESAAAAAQQQQPQPNVKQQQQPSSRPADVFACLQEFAVAARRRGGAGMRAALARAAELPGATAEHLLRLAAVAADPEYGDPAVLPEALAAALRRLLAATAPDAPKVALVVRQMVGAASGDAARLRVFGEAVGIVGALPPKTGGAGGGSGGYPEREARWLAATCWNLGLARLRAGGQTAALPYLRHGLALMRLVAAASAHAASTGSGGGEGQAGGGGEDGAAAAALPAAAPAQRHNLAAMEVVLARTEAAVASGGGGGEGGLKVPPPPKSSGVAGAVGGGATASAAAAAASIGASCHPSQNSHG